MRTYHLKTPVATRTAISYEQSLNSEQLAVVLHGDGIVLILAGPGSGKTRTLVYRVAYLLEQRVLPQEIMLVTFTNKAAREMLSRVEGLVGTRPRGLWGGTFHHLGHLVMRTYGDCLGYQPSFGILDEEDSRHMIDLCLEDMQGSNSDRYLPSSDVLQSILSFSVNTQRPILQVLESHFPQCLEVAEVIVRVGEAYTHRKRMANVLDYDDLLEQWRVLMVQQTQVQHRLSQQLRYILVDEFQDTNRLQLAILQQLMVGHRNLMVVGDDAQGIYSFRGADIRNILEFPEAYPDAKIFKLEMNYRSVPQILRLANASISCNRRQFHKTLRSTKHDGPPPVAVYVEDAFQQAACVAQRLLELTEGGMRLNDIGVLFRARYHSAELELELMRRGIPYVVRGGVRFFEQAHIKDVIAYLRVVTNPNDELAWKRVLLLEPGIGKTLAGRIWELLPKPLRRLNDVLREGTRLDGGGRQAQRGVASWARLRTRLRDLLDLHLTRHPGQAIRRIMEQGYQQYVLAHFRDGADRIDDLEQLANFASGYDSYDRLLTDVSLREGFKGERVALGHEEGDEACVVLSTIHQAKGLEWSAVMLIGMTEGQFPHTRAVRDPEQMEEERRLFYVGVTRAKEQLYLLIPMTRMTPNGAVIARPSLFIRELPKHCYETWRASEHAVLTEEPNREDPWLTD